MPNRQPESRVLSAFTSEQWSGKPAKGGGSMFFGFAVIGAVVCLVLMIFVPVLRSGGAFTFFTAVFAVVFTVLTIKGKTSAERKFLAGVTGTVNDMIIGLTGDIAHQLSVKQFRSLIETGMPMPLLVNGVSGLELVAIREQPRMQERTPVVKRVDNVIGMTRIVITATPPDYGITSFDHLLAAAADLDGDSGPQRKSG